MQRVRIYLATIALSVATIGMTVAARAQSPAKAVDVTGKWLFTVTTDAGSGTPTITLKQQGDSLTGHYSSQTFGESDFKGTVKDSKIKFSINVDAQGTALVVTYSGTVESNDAMKGTVDLGGMGNGTFTAKRQ
jgi:hypothetical protein